MGLTKYKLGDLVYELNTRNDDLKYGIDAVHGISNTKEIMPTKVNVNKEVIQKFYVIMPEEFIYNPRTTRMGDKVGLAYNNTGQPLLFTFNNVAFAIKKTAKDIIMPDYLYIFFNRSEFDRYAMINSWGSATELFAFKEMCDVEIKLPPIEIQQKYVDIYNAMVENQKAYERGLEDLKLSIDVIIERFKYSENYISLGEIIEESDVRNGENVFSVVYGVNKDKKFMPSVANSEDLSKYKIVKRGQFACNLMHVGRDVAVPIALHKDDVPIIVSPAYLVFNLKNKMILPEYVMMWLSRNETDRYAWFLSDTNVRSGMEKKRFYEIKIPIPSIQEQKAAVEIYSVYSMRQDINEYLKAKARNICPILIKGSLKEAKERLETE